MTWQERLRALRQRPAQRWLLAGMSLSLLLPFFGPAEGCPGSAPFPCEADPVVDAAVEIIELWVARRGDPYAVEVEPFACPDHGRLDGEVRLPVDSSFGDPEDRHSRCSTHAYWQERRSQKAGDHLRQRLRERFIIEREDIDHRRPRQPDVRVTVACETGTRAGELACDLVAELFVPATGGKVRHGAVEREERRIAFDVPADPGAVPLATPPSALSLLGLTVSAGMGPLALFDGGLELVDFTYIFLLALTAVSLALVRRGWWPQLDRLCVGAVAFVAAISVLGLGADAYRGCESLMTALPDQQLRAWLDAFLRRAQIGALLFAPLAVARFVLVLRGGAGTEAKS